MAPSSRRFSTASRLPSRIALGAKRSDILAHILAENFFIIFIGVCVGSLLAFTVNLGLMHYLEMTRPPTAYIALGSALLLMLGQCAGDTGPSCGANVTNGSHASSDRLS